VDETAERCPSCGALVSRDSEWCGQCLSPLRPTPGPTPTGEPQGGSPPAAHAEGDDRAGAPPPPRRLPTWACPVCEHENAIELDRCEICDAPFGRLFAEPETRPEVDPTRAFAWSLLLPGLGHWMAGRKAEGVARMVLFAWAFGTLIVLVAARWGRGLGSTAPLVFVYLVATVGLMASSAVDARRIASGEDPLVGSRALMWAAVGLIGMSVAIATVLAFSAARAQ
jgi:hypothetical protein